MEEPDHGILGSGLVEAFTPEMREKMVRLEKENQLLWRRVETAESTPSRAVAEGRGKVISLQGFVQGYGFPPPPDIWYRV